MKSTLDRIRIYNEELNTLLTKDLKAKVAFKVGKFKKHLHEIVSLFEENRSKVFAKYHTSIEKNDQGQDFYAVAKDHENYPKFIAELEELFTLEQEIDDFSLSVEELGDVDLQPKFFINMGDLITG